ncbi:hypothetical protein GOP47_0020994 [Adiantum capillus-veneris]|uniref:Pre-mRNA polyadenylation factor Fip1 domain-containing protein n=1 Tax=Adiantum capillus-veneris TaxID=13818 RepID=A0A9D4UA85_ADICA|nr:hypothetical protein GOP47_0020994 [Adiantum capillus-veneris]
MAMAACGEDEFGNLFADVHVEDVHALRGFGSLHWSLEDESDTSPTREVPIAGVHGCYANVTCAQVELGTSSVECVPRKDNRAGHENNCKNGSIDAAGIAFRADDLATDSDDDLRIVLGPLRKAVNEGIADDSEDGEDFVVLTGNGQEWREKSVMHTEDSAQAKAVRGEKIGSPVHEQVQNQKSSGVHPRICYGGQAYRRHYRYVRAYGKGGLGAVSTGNARLANGRPYFAKSKRIGGGRGFTNSHRIARGTGAVRGLSSGPEYILPFNKTVFDIDIDAFKEKPWRLSNIDVSDYFNFELDESGWKKYCKQLMQFCLEVTTQSKISVYEGRRVAQPKAGDIQAGAGAQISAEVHGLQSRDSDAIFLVDVKEDDAPQTCIEGHQDDVGDARKALDLVGVNMNLNTDNTVCKLEKEQPSIERSTRTNRKRSNAVLKEFSVNELQENGSVVAVSRLKTPSPATPPERLPTRVKRDVMIGAKKQSGGPRVGQADHDTGELRTSKENLQLAENRTSLGSESLNAASGLLSKRKDFKRGGTDAIAAQVNKKRRLDSHQANHGCRFASLLIKKLSRVRATKAVPMPTPEADTLPLGNDFTRNKTSESFIDGKASGNVCNRPSRVQVTEAAETQEKAISTDKTSSKKKGKASCIEVRDVLEDIPCEPIKETSREKLKVKKSKKGHKGHKGKERVKSKDKVHLPGCPNFKKGLKKNDLMKGMGNVSMVGFISNDNKVYWKKVDSLCQGIIEDQDAEKMSITYKNHETKERIEDRSVLERTDVHLITVGEGRESKKRKLKTSNERTSDSIHTETRGCDVLLEGNAMNSWNAVKPQRGKKKLVKHMLIQEMRLASSKAHSLAGSKCETHANVSMQVPLGEQTTLLEKRKQFEDRGRNLISRQPHLESKYQVQGCTNSTLVANGQARKKKHSKKSLHKVCRKGSNKLTPSVNQEEEQNNRFNNLSAYGAATTRSRKAGYHLDSCEKSREAALESCQTEPLSTKVERTNGASRTILGRRVQNPEKYIRQTKWHCQETKSFWAFSV